MRISDWSSDVCSSDLLGFELPFEIGTGSTLGKQRLLNFVRRTVKCKMPTPVVACSGTEELGRWRYARDHRIRYRQLLDPVGMIGCHGKTDPHADIVPRHAKSLRSEEHTSELQSLMRISYAVFCLKKKTNTNTLPKPT